MVLLSPRPMPHSVFSWALFVSQHTFHGLTLLYSICVLFVLPSYPLDSEPRARQGLCAVWETVRSNLNTFFWNMWPQETQGLTGREDVDVPPNTATGYLMHIAGIISILSSIDLWGHLYRELFCTQEKLEEPWVRAQGVMRGHDEGYNMLNGWVARTQTGNLGDERT